MSTSVMYNLTSRFVTVNCVREFISPSYEKFSLLTSNVFVSHETFHIIIFNINFSPIANSSFIQLSYNLKCVPMLSDLPSDTSQVCFPGWI